MKLVNLRVFSPENQVKFTSDFQKNDFTVLSANQKRRIIGGVVSKPKVRIGPPEDDDDDTPATTIYIPDIQARP